MIFRNGERPRDRQSKNFQSGEDLLQTILIGDDERTMRLPDLMRWLNPLMRDQRFLDEVRRTRSELSSEDELEIIIGVFENVDGNSVVDEMVTDKYLIAKMEKIKGKPSLQTFIVEKKAVATSDNNTEIKEVRKRVNMFDRHTNFFQACGIRNGSEFAIVLDFDNGNDESGDTDEVIPETTIRKDKIKKKRRVRGPKSRDTVQGKKELKKKLESQEFVERLEALNQLLSGKSEQELLKWVFLESDTLIIKLFEFMEGKDLIPVLAEIIKKDRGSYHKLIIQLARFVTIRNIGYGNPLGVKGLAQRAKILAAIKRFAHNILSINKSSMMSTIGASFLCQMSIRNLREYIGSLFPYNTASEEEQAMRLTGTTLDIGGGLTIQREDSLFNFVNSKVPGARFISLDPMYNSETSPWSRQVENNTIDPESLPLELRDRVIPGFAQDIPLENNSIDRVLSLWVFDKFNEETGGTEQALREIARILKAGSEFRVYGFRESMVKLSVLRKYFEIKDLKWLVGSNGDPTKTYDLKSEPLCYLFAKKRTLSKNEEEQLEQEAFEWKAKYLA